MSEQPSEASPSSLAGGNGDEVSPDAIAGRIDSLKMAGSFDNNANSGLESAGPSRSESPTDAAVPETHKVSPPAGGTQSTLLHSTPTASDIPLDLSDVGGTFAAGPGLPFRRGAASSTTTGTSRPTHSAAPMLHELTPVIRNTSGSGKILTSVPPGATSSVPMPRTSVRCSSCPSRPAAVSARLV